MWVRRNRFPNNSLGIKIINFLQIVCKINLCQGLTNIVMTLANVAFAWVWFPKIDSAYSKEWHEELVGSQN